MKLPENSAEALPAALSGERARTEETSDPRRAGNLRMEAARCRRLSSSVLDRKTIDTLQSLAEEYEAEAERLSRVN